MRISDWSSDVCSSDLTLLLALLCVKSWPRLRQAGPLKLGLMAVGGGMPFLLVGMSGMQRSEEHTSELQSLMRISYAGFCLEKKNTDRTHSRYDCSSTCRR